MSEFEKALLFSEFLNTSNFIFSNYMALTFAMLTASYFLAHRMGIWVGLLFLSLYSIAAAMAGSGVYFAFSDFARLGMHIHETASDSVDLAWLGPVRNGGMTGLMPDLVLGMAVASYLGSIAFFFVVRAKRIHADERANSKDEAQP